MTTQHRSFIVDLKDVSTTYFGKKPYVVGWGSGCGFGAFTEAEALAEAARLLPTRLQDRACSVAGVCIEIARTCDVCKVTGIKPGCKRKRCEACGGWGTVDRYGFVVLNPGVDPLLAEEGVYSTNKRAR